MTAFAMTNDTMFIAIIIAGVGGSSAVISFTKTSMLVVSGREVIYDIIVLIDDFFMIEWTMTHNIIFNAVIRFIISRIWRSSWGRITHDFN